MPQTLHNAIHKYFIVEEELNSGVKVELLLGRHDICHLEHRNKIHSLERLPGNVIHLECLYLLHHVDMLPVKGLHIEHLRNSSCSILNNNKNIDLFQRIDQELRTIDQQILPLYPGAQALKIDVGLVENPTIREISLLKR